MREPDLSDLTLPEVCLGLATAAAAYFWPPLLFITVPAMGAIVVRRVQPDAFRGMHALPGTLRQLPTAALARLQDARAAQAARDAARVAQDPPAPAQARQEPAGELVETLEATPHRLIIGHTRGGKTTLIHHMATRWAAQGERVLVGDPDAAPGLWPGCEVRGYGDDVNSIGELLAIVSAEVAQRRTLRAQGVRRFEPLHLVIDEAQDVLPVVEGGLELFEDVARRGGKLNIRMTVGVQDKQVKTLGLEGKSALLRNLQIADVLKGRDGHRVAVLRDAETGGKVTMPIPQLVDPESLITTVQPSTQTTQNLRLATPAAPAPAPDDLLANLLAAPVPARPNAERPLTGISTRVDTDTDTSAGITVDTGAGGHVTVNVKQVMGRPARRAGTGLKMRGRHQRLARYQQIKSLVREGKGTNEVYRIVRGNRNEVSEDVRRAKKELGLVS